MGGTSTDVSHFAGEFERVFDTQVAGGRAAVADSLGIRTVMVLPMAGVLSALGMGWPRPPPCASNRWSSHSNRPPCRG
ncbi:5-oxoprolinase (ATP-hydrolyzing) [Rhodococcus opacus RKJ300 = JCM 13270]|uniref:5-oxoprolinase (ATP-hydrolyzing) n=1 Tax=Rhodococcus opacus RKJ300 = JCM 13270 TaxID=1165867 RepID=I0WNS0_RHOOP|nr:5-oxoprolinase (ATP-hydrolyzing) [Rhodococcus opacus RKJ300 = JCM 13270]